MRRMDRRSLLELALLAPGAALLRGGPIAADGPPAQSATRYLWFEEHDFEFQTWVVLEWREGVPAARVTLEDFLADGWQLDATAPAPDGVHTLGIFTRPRPLSHQP